MTENPPQDSAANADPPEFEDDMPDIEDVPDQNAKAAPEDDVVIIPQAPKRSMVQQADYTGIAIIDDDMQVDQERINEERKAYLEESRSQEVSD